jgi:hypothetical protein
MNISGKIQSLIGYKMYSTDSNLEIESIIKSELSEFILSSGGDNFDDINFSLSISDISGSYNLLILSKNFFTALLLKGIYHPQSLYSDLFETDYDIYTWCSKSNQLSHKKKSISETRESKINKIIK